MQPAVIDEMVQLCNSQHGIPSSPPQHTVVRCSMLCDSFKVPVICYMQVSWPTYDGLDWHDLEAFNILKAVARNCLCIDPHVRTTARDIQARLYEVLSDNGCTTCLTDHR